jgi:hypothetical protein
MISYCRQWKSVPTPLRKQGAVMVKKKVLVSITIFAWIILALTPLVFAGPGTLEILYDDGEFRLDRVPRDEGSLLRQAPASAVTLYSAYTTSQSDPSTYNPLLTSDAVYLYVAFSVNVETSATVVWGATGPDWLNTSYDYEGWIFEPGYAYYAEWHPSNVTPGLYKYEGRVVPATGGPPGADRQCQFLVTTEEDIASVRFYNALTCGGSSFSATLDICGASLDSETGSWSSCETVDSGNCSASVYATTNCGTIDISGSVSLEADCVYSFVLYLDESDNVVLLYDETCPGDCNTVTPFSAGASLRSLSDDGSLEILMKAQVEGKGFRSAP